MARQLAFKSDTHGGFGSGHTVESWVGSPKKVSRRCPNLRTDTRAGQLVKDATSAGRSVVELDRGDKCRVVGEHVG